MIKAEIHQSLLKGGQRLPKKLVQKTLREVSKELVEKGDKRVSIAFVSHSQMKHLNKTYRGKDAVTDVLSFSLDDETHLGELILNYGQAKKQAVQMKHIVRHELVFLIVHGLLHLYGFDHETEKEQKVMFEKQARILTRLGINPAI